MSNTTKARQSFILSELIEQFADDIGYFDTGQPIQRLADVNYIQICNNPITFNQDTKIAYFPGCFSEFHEGHLSVIEAVRTELSQDTDNYVIVVAPANTDYTASKYGTETHAATNAYRANRIDDMISADQGYNVIIDLNPMLNYDRDYNFTDLLFNFIEDQGLDYDSLTHTPYIVCGKDRGYFKNLEQLTDKIKVFFAEDITGASSSGILRENQNLRPKKDLMLRVNNMDQFDVFVRYFEDQYASITPIMMKDELEAVRFLHAENPFDFTNCKDYKDIIPYVAIHREFEHPLIRSNVHSIERGVNLKGCRVLDSDIFTGGTRDFIENIMGGELTVLFDCSEMENIELLDIMDFYKDDYGYPNVDITSRCSMQPFTVEFHKKYNEFKSVIKSVSAEIL